MYCYQFQDGSWRITKLTSSKFEPPVRGAAWALYERPYVSREEAEEGIRRIRALQISSPACWWNARGTAA
jgi:hypothetical protein